MDKPTVGMSVRRGGAKLRALSKAHSPLHVMLWQAKEAQSALLAAAAAQKMLFNDIAAWASAENRALSDVCSCANELSSLYSDAQVQIALAYKAFRKDMTLILEGENRCDKTKKSLQLADEKRLKLRRQVLRAQNKRLIDGENPRRAGDFTAMQTQLAEAERTADRLHVEAVDATREQEAVKLVVIRSALAKLAESHLTLSTQAKVIFEAEREITQELPEPLAPGDPLSSMRYNGHENTRAVVERAKSQVLLVSPPTNPSYQSPTRNPGGIIAVSPSGPSWSSTPIPTAPPSHIYNEGEMENDPPPPYNSFFSSTAAGERVNGEVYEGQGRRRRAGSSGRGVRRSLYGNATVSPSASNASGSNSSGNRSSTRVSPRYANVSSSGNGEVRGENYGNPFEVSPEREGRY